MPRTDPTVFHHLYGIRRPRLAYRNKDFLDYVLMISLCALVITISYGVEQVMARVGLVLCAFALVVFMMRHGIEFRVPVILKRPQEVLYVLVYKIQNLRPVYFVALGLLLLENFLIALTPDLPHHVGLMRKVAFYAFYLHFISITAYRTVILVAHLIKRDLVREILIQTPWRKLVKGAPSITLEIVHAYCSGVLTHIILVAPWYLVITYARFSVLFLPIVCLINIFVELQWIKMFNSWFCRDHWLGHNSEFEFLFLHGTHHDAIPSGLIAVSENSLLEGFMRFTVGGFPTAFYNPLISFLVYTIGIKTDIDVHQYIPGIFPRLSRRVIETNQHATHHCGVLAPYSLGTRPEYFSISDMKIIKIARKFVPAENAVKLDEELTGFKWDNSSHLKILNLYDKYHT